MTVSLRGCPMLRLRSRSRSPNASRGGAAVEAQVVAVLDLGEEEPVLTTSVLAFVVPEEGCKRGQPLLAAGQQIPGGQRIGKLLKALRIATT